MTMMDFINNLLQPVPLLSGAIVAAIASHMWRRYRDRLISLNWQVANHRVAQAGDNRRFGKIEVLYNGALVRNVGITTITIENGSNKDLNDLPINVYFNDGANIRMAVGAVWGSANELRFTKEFDAALERLLGMKPEDPGYADLLSSLTRRRDFLIPVMNRDAKISITLVVEGPPSGQLPNVNVGTDYVGVRLRKRPPVPMIFGVHLGHAVLTGIVVGAVISLAIATIEIPALALSGLSFTIGAAVTLLGVIVIRGARLVGRLLS
ncbi:MAG: hypothetical protein AABM33_13380 [Pseudomonadota bacterium]